MTPNQRNAESAFKGATDGDKLPDFIARQFDQEPDVSWRELERRILVETNAECLVSHATLPNWYGHLKPDADAGEGSPTSEAVAS